jgi:ElaB/YqjD/DUF883 family membrane-anchored ribosome-binding protein
MTVADQQVALEAKEEALVELEAQLEQQAAEMEAAQRAAARELREELDAAHAAERAAMEKDWRETIDVRIALGILSGALLCTRRCVTSVGWETALSEASEARV